MFALRSWDGQDMGLTWAKKKREREREREGGDVGGV